MAYSVVSKAELKAAGGGGSRGRGGYSVASQAELKGMTEIRTTKSRGMTYTEQRNKAKADRAAAKAQQSSSRRNPATRQAIQTSQRYGVNTGMSNSGGLAASSSSYDKGQVAKTRQKIAANIREGRQFGKQYPGQTSATYAAHGRGKTGFAVGARSTGQRRHPAGTSRGGQFAGKGG